MAHDSSGYPSDTLSSKEAGGEAEQQSEEPEEGRCNMKRKRKSCTRQKKLTKRVRRMSSTPGCRMLVFVRHGDYKDWSEEQGLTSAGRIQAWQAFEGILKMTSEHNIFITEKIIHSVLKRAQETAQIIATLMDVSMECDPLLNEGDPSNPDVKKQFEDVFNKYFIRTEPLNSHVMDIIVTHANVIRYLVCK